jgi:hypothetical protein
MDDDGGFALSHFNPALVKANSIVTIIGPRTNTKAIYKDYGNYFDNHKQLQNIMSQLKPNQALVIDETAPKNQLSELLYIYNIRG